MPPTYSQLQEILDQLGQGADPDALASALANFLRRKAAGDLAAGSTESTVLTTITKDYGPILAAICTLRASCADRHQRQAVASQAMEHNRLLAGHRR